MQTNFEHAKKAHDEFQSARRDLVEQIDAEIAGLQQKRREVLAWGKAEAVKEPKRRGRPRKDEKKDAAD